MQLKTFFFFLLFSFLQTKTKTKERAFSTEWHAGRLLWGLPLSEKNWTFFVYFRFDNFFVTSLK
jgi:hypothetical protein